MSHPTIAIGYGSYGMRLMRLLLSSAAARGALGWIEHGEGSGGGERRLRGLSLIWLPSAAEERAKKTALNSDNDPALELFDDLYTQIETVDAPHAEMGRLLSAAVSRERDRLVQLEELADKGGRLGLDIFFLARPATQQALGHLRELINHVLESLGRDRLLYASNQRTNVLLNALAFFDFEDIWDASMKRVRRGIGELIEQRKPQFEKGNPVLGRIYLFDKTSGSGAATAQRRLEQAALLLNLLIFENVRGAPEIQDFYTPKSAEESPLCSAGLRSVERSSGLLLHLAAASYTRAWMQYVAGEAMAVGRTPALAKALERFSADRLPATLGEPEFRAVCERQVERIRSLLAAVPSGDSWAVDLPTAVLQQVAEALGELADRFVELGRKLEKNELQPARLRLRATVDRLLSSQDPPVSLGTIVRQIENLRDEFEKVCPAPGAATSEALELGRFDDVAAMFAEAQLHAARQVDAAYFGARWWPGFGLLYGCAVTPYVLDCVDQFWHPGPPTWIVVPTAILALGAAAWFCGRTVTQREIARLTRRTRQYYDDPAIGRLAQRLREAADGALVAGRIRQFGEGLLNTLRRRAFAALAIEARRILEALQARQKEAQWLERQCEAFLDLHGVDDGGKGPVFREGRDRSPWSRNLSCDEDLKLILQNRRRDPEGFASLQAHSNIFQDWRDAYYDRLLHPTRVLDTVAGTLSDTRLAVAELQSQQETEIERFTNDTELSSPAGFRWLASDGLPNEIKLAVQPRGLNHLPSLAQTLELAGFTGRILKSDGDRLYLVKARLGVDPALLGVDP